MSNAGAVRRIAEAVEHFARLACAQRDSASINFEHLVTEYLALRKSLAREFQVLAHEELALDDAKLNVIRRRISQRMRELYGGRLPDAHLEVKGYTGVHLILFEYLSRHAGQPVSAGRLRVLTADQVHTERRLRELRDLGLGLTTTQVADDDHYVLQSDSADLDFAARFQAEHNVRNDRRLSSGEKERLLQTISSVSAPT